MTGRFDGEAWDGGEGARGPRVSRGCPVCRHAESELLLESWLPLPSGHPLGERIREVECPSCGAVYVDPVGTDEEYARYYDDLSKYGCLEVASGTGLKPHEERRFAAVVARLGRHLDSRSARILDVGCATGGLIRALQRAGYDGCCGVDPSSACVDFVRRELGVDAWVADASSLPKELSPLGGAILSHVLEHLRDPGSALDEIGSRLQERGPVYVEVPDAARYVDFLNAPFQDFNPEHINHFSLGTLTTLLERHGFRPVESGTAEIESAPGQPYPVVYAVAVRTPGGASPTTRDDLLGRRIREYVGESRRLLEAMSGAIDRCVRDGERLIVWGAGSLALRLLAESSLSRKKIVCFVDTNPALHGRDLAGIRVVSPGMISADDGTPILIASSIHEESIRKDLAEKWALRNPVIGLGAVVKSFRSPA